MVIKTKAIVIKEYTVGESDKYITLFTKDLGKIQALAPKAKKHDNNLASGAQLFVYGEFMVASFKDTYRIMNIEVITTFHELRKDLLILSYASYILEFVAEVAQEEPGQDQLLVLTLVALQALVKQKLSIRLIRRIFELRAMSLLGFMPQLDQCVDCLETLQGDSRSFYSFVCEAGGIICRNCNSEYRKSIAISFATRYTMDFIIHTPIKALFSFELQLHILHELEIVCSAYMDYYIEKSFKTLGFIKQLES